MVFNNFLKCLTFTLFFLSTSAQHVEVKCYDSNSPTGRYLGNDYQIVYVAEKHYLELECKACNESATFNNATWSLINLTTTTTNPIYNPFKTNSRKFKKHMKILENNTLYIENIKPKYSGLYSCKTTTFNTTNNSTIEKLYNYLIYVIAKKNISEIPTGTVTDWKKYRENVLDVVDAKLDEESVQDEIAKLGVSWSDSTDCLCGSFKFDTKRFRFAYPYVVVNESDYHAPIFPVQSIWLGNLYPLFATIVQNVTIFREYERCVEDCIPDAMETDVDYKYEDSIYISEGADMKLICPDSENASEILWVFNEATILPKALHSFGTGKIENHIAVDTLDELYLIKVRPLENGIYSCIVDDAPIKKITITVVPRSIFLTKEFLRCVLTIAYVLIFSFIICIFILCAKIYYIHSVYKK